MNRKWIKLLSLILLAFVSSLGAEDEKSLKLLFVGDLMGHIQQIQSAEVEENTTYNYAPCLQYVRPIIEKADLAIANLEVTLPGEPPYTGFPRFRSPDAWAFAIKDAGFDLLTTANNHCCDSGPEGLVQTLQILDDLEFLHTGTFRNPEERNATYPLIVHVNGFKLAFLSYTYGTNRIKPVPPNVVNLIDEELIEQDMQTARELKPDAIIVMMHWGREYRIVENNFQRKLAKKLFDWGALLVIGAHPHILQPIKEEIVDSKKRVVAYSLGNFISGQTKPNTDSSIIFEVELKKLPDSGDTVIDSHHYIPTWRYIQKKKGEKDTYMTIPASPFEKKPPKFLGMSKTDRKDFKRAAKWTRQHLSQYDSKERKISLAEILE